MSNLSAGKFRQHYSRNEAADFVQADLEAEKKLYRTLMIRVPDGRIGAVVDVVYSVRSQDYRPVMVAPQFLYIVQFHNGSVEEYLEHELKAVTGKQLRLCRTGEMH